jgi:hypothetical protein
VLNTVLYNWEEEANNEVKIGQGNTSSTSAAAIVPRNHLEDNLDAAALLPTLTYYLTEKLTSLQKG